MKKFKKALSMLTAVVMLCGLMCVTAFAEETTEVADSLSFIVGEESFSTWADAKSYADDEGFSTITLGADSTLASALVIDSGYTLVVPTSADASDSETGNNVSGGVSDLAEGIKLTMTGDASITVNGTLLVAGNQQSTQPKSGCLTGSYGVINMASGATITVNDGGKLYARGEISGEGSVVADSGSTVYQLFQISDWRGGTKAMDAYATNDIFPFNLYEIKNITVPTTYYNGATLYGQYYIVAYGSGVPGQEIVIGDGGQIEFADSTTVAPNDKVVMSFSGDVATVNVQGALKTGNINVSMSIFGQSYEISSANQICPFGYNMNVVIDNGGSLVVSNELKFLPGCEVTVNEGGSLTVDEGAAMYFYGTNYSSDYNYAGWTSASAAKLTIASGATLRNSGIIASSDDTYTNIDGYSGTTTTEAITVYEYIQSTGATPVTFYSEATDISGEDTAE